MSRRVASSSFKLPSYLRTRYPRDPKNPHLRPQRTPFGAILLLAQVGLAFHLTSTYLFSISQTKGISMVPTIAPRGALCLLSHLHRHGKNISVGDVVVFAHPVTPGARAAKRVIGMPGDFVCVVTPGKREDGEDGAGKAEYTEMMIQVPEGHCWVEGDNLEWSRDSRIYGAIPLNLVTSKVLAKIFPPGEAGWIRNTMVPVGTADEQVKIIP